MKLEIRFLSETGRVRTTTVRVENDPTPVVIRDLLTLVPNRATVRRINVEA